MKGFLIDTGRDDRELELSDRQPRASRSEERAELERRQRAASHDPTLPIVEVDPLLRRYREAIRRLALSGYTGVQAYPLAQAVEGEEAARLPSDVLKAHLSAATGKPGAPRLYALSALEADEWTPSALTNDLDRRRVRAWVIRQTPYVETREGPFVGQFAPVELHHVWRGGALPDGEDDQLIARYWAQETADRSLRRAPRANGRHLRAVPPRTTDSTAGPGRAPESEARGARRLTMLRGSHRSRTEALFAPLLAHVSFGAAMSAERFLLVGHRPDTARFVALERPSFANPRFLFANRQFP